MRPIPVAVLVALLTAGCAPTTTQYFPPSSPPPETGYVATDYGAGVLWEGVLDWVATHDGEWEPWSTDTFIRGRIVIAGEASAGDRRATSRDGDSADYADCGYIDGAPAAGRGPLTADVTIRVRRDLEDGRGLLQVAVPRLQVAANRLNRTEWAFGPPFDRPGTGPVECVSTGRLERETVEAILERVEPVMKAP